MSILILNRFSLSVWYNKSYGNKTKLKLQKLIFLLVRLRHNETNLFTFQCTEYCTLSHVEGMAVKGEHGKFVALNTKTCAQ